MRTNIPTDQKKPCVPQTTRVCTVLDNVWTLSRPRVAVLVCVVDEHRYVHPCHYPRVRGAVSYTRVSVVPVREYEYGTTD